MHIIVIIDLEASTEKTEKQVQTQLQVVSHRSPKTPKLHKLDDFMKPLYSFQCPKGIAISRHHHRFQRSIDLVSHPGLPRVPLLHWLKTQVPEDF